jgi:hypothetical protein
MKVRHTSGFATGGYTIIIHKADREYEIEKNINE